MRKLIKPLALTMALTIPAIAGAEVNTSQVTDSKVLITYNADDAVTNYGRIELELQIRRAAEKVCGSQHRSSAASIRQLMKNRSCFEKAVAEALNSISATH